MVTTSRYVLCSVGGGDITLSRARDAGPKARETQVTEAQLQAALELALDDDRSRRRLAEFLDGLGLARFAVMVSDRRRIHDVIDRALWSNQIIAYEVPRRRVIMHVDAPIHVLGPEAEPTSWIEIVLLDDDGNPVCDEPYKVEDPSGRVFRGTTNLSGMARIEGIDPGSCKVSFPALPPEWKKAG